MLCNGIIVLSKLFCQTSDAISRARTMATRQCQHSLAREIHCEMDELNSTFLCIVVIIAGSLSPSFAALVFYLFLVEFNKVVVPFRALRVGTCTFVLSKQAAK